MPDMHPLLLSDPFPHGSTALQGHVLLCMLAWSVTINAIADWHALACNLKWHKTCLNGHLWICCKICLNIKTLNLFCFFCLVVDLFINVAHQHDPLEHRLLLIWERCDLKGPCLCFLIQLRDGRHTNLTVKRQPCLNNNGILKIRHS